MSKSGWEAMPIDSPSSIYSADPSARVLSTSEITTSAPRSSAGTRVERGNQAGVDTARRGLGRATEAIGGTVVRSWGAAGPLGRPALLPDRFPVRGADP